MAKKPAKPKGPKQSKASTKARKPYQKPTVSDDDEDELDFSDHPRVPTPTRLNNCYAEWLADPLYIKSQRALAKEHGVWESSLRNRINGAKSKEEDAQERQRLTVLEELALKDWC
jgi:hypothetical protein